jgi:hypothetical protein
MNVHAPGEKKSNDSKDSFYEALCSRLCVTAWEGIYIYISAFTNTTRISHLKINSLDT